MADKTYEIEIQTTSDTEGITSVKDALSETKEEASSTQDALQEAFESATEEVERLEEALTEAEINGDDIGADIISDELAEAREKAEELESQLESVNSTGVDGAKESVDGLNDSVQQATDSTESLGANMGLIDSAVMMDMANQFSSAGSNAEGMAQQIETASISVGQLSKNVGVAEPQMVSMINHISNATFPQNEALAYANALNQMGVSAGQLGDSATNMDKINDATGIGYEKVIKLTQGLQSMGITADNLPASFNAIAYAQSNVTGGTDTLQRTLMRQAGTIKEYGMNVDQVVLIMSKLSERGVSTTKMGTELSKVLKDNNGDLSAIEQELGLTAGSLSHASDETGKYEGKLQSLANEEAEHKTILEQMGAVWEDITLSMSPFLTVGGSIIGVLGQIGSTALSINSMVQLYENFKKWERLQNVFNGVNGRLSSLKNSFVSFGGSVKNAITPVANFGRTIGSSLLNASKSAVTSLGSLAKAVLLTGANAVKSAGMWLIQKAQLIATYVVNGLVTASQWLLNIAMSMNPIGIVIMAIVALIAVLTYLYFNNEQVRGAIDGLGQSIMQVAQMIWDTLVMAFNMVISTLQSFWNYIVGLGANLLAQVGITNNGIIAGILGFLVFFATLPIRIAVTFANLIARALGFGNNFVQNIVNAGSHAVSGFISSIGQMASGLANELNNMLSLVGEWASTLPQKFWDAGVNAVKNFLSALGIRSPGTMQRMMVWEVNEMGNRIPRESQGLMTNIRRMGEKVVDEFGNPVLSVGTAFENASFKNTDSQGSSSQVFNFNFSDVVIDNEDRMQKIVEAVRKEINWNNKTAGRTI